MKTVTKKDYIFEGFNIRVRTPEGTIYVIISVDQSEEPKYIFISAGKGGQALAILVNAMANMINKMLDVGISISTIIRCLDTPYSPKYAQNDNGIRIHSVPHGIQWALIQFLQLKTNSIKLNVAS